MKLQNPVQVLALSGILSSAAFCSEEVIHTSYKLSSWADTGNKSYGNVSAAIERTHPGSTYPYKPVRVKSITLVV